MYNPLAINSEPTQFNFFSNYSLSKKMKITLAIFNAILFFTISKVGADSAKKIQALNTNTGDNILLTSAIFSAVYYGVFFYLTLGIMQLYPKDKLEKILTFFAIISASAFFTAGKEGAESLGISEPIAFANGFILFLFRIVNCVDSAVQLPSRTIELIQRVQNSVDRRHTTAEVVRLFFALILSLEYSAASTDSMFSAFSATFDLLAIPMCLTRTIFEYFFASVGAIGTLFLTAYWMHRGIAECTFGKHPDAAPTDCYILLAVILCIPTTAGALGPVSAKTAVMFSKGGEGLNWVTVGVAAVFSFMGYAPGVAGILRSCHFKPAEKNREEDHLVDNTSLRSFAAC
ncbi:MAG: hypothetical protein A3E82_00490 [Gammaproteobacteria bacterium RIFCSPHIGHO2_12_FULL_38_11]|nr:MAG: hypothetical protein A3E82_00490 [Gammaproteobacteria bacterium RIFCSPHIGHO2_12_FULL_38_11]